MTPSSGQICKLLLLSIPVSARLKFTHTREGSYGPGEDIEFHGKFDLADLDNLVNFDLSIFDQSDKRTNLANRKRLDCSIETLDRFENGEARPLTQENYFNHYFKDSVQN